MNENFDDPAQRLRRAAQSSPAAPELSDELVTGAADRSAPRLVRRGRAARGAGIAFVAVAAVSAGALVMPSLLTPTAPLFTAAGGSEGGEAAALSADSKIAMWVNYAYVAGAGLSADGGNATVYELRRTGDPETVLGAAADALGLDGKAAEASYSSPEYPSYIVGPEDGSAPSLVLSWSGTGGWWYNDPTAYPAQVCEQVPVVNEDGTASTETYPSCTQPQVPASESLAPSVDEARDLAAAIFAETGFEVESSAIRVTADEWQTVATAALTVDGVSTALEASIGWTPLGKIAWASGHSVEVVARGDHGTVSAASAVDRLADWRWYGAAGPDYTGGAVALAADSGIARKSAEASTEPAEPATEPATEPAPANPAPAEPAPSDTPAEPAPTVDPAPDGDTIDPGIVEPMPEPMPTPETVTVTLEKAEATLLLMWDADGNAWLVPGYAYENPEQGFWTSVVSLVDGVIALPEPVEVEPLPAVVD